MRPVFTVPGVAFPFDTKKLKLDGRVVTAALVAATALSSTPARAIMSTIVIDEYMPTIIIEG